MMFTTFSRTQVYLHVSNKVYNSTSSIVNSANLHSRQFASNTFLKVNNRNVFCLNCAKLSYCSNSAPRPSLYGRNILFRQSQFGDCSFSIQNRSFSSEKFESLIGLHSSLFMRLSESTVVSYVQNSLVQFHDITGLSWWSSIILTTIMLRSVILFPIAIYQNYVIAKLENARKEMDGIVNDLKYELNREIRRNNWSEKEARRHLHLTVRKEWTRLIERDNCHPAKISILAVFQIPLWVVLSTAIRNLVYKLPHHNTWAELKFLELSVGGVAWFPNLTVPDSFIIPIALGLANLTICEIQSMMYKGEKTRLYRYMTNFFRGFSIFMIPVAASVPSCLTLYWMCSSMFGVFQNLSLLSPRVRRFFGIPITRSTNLHPYTHLVEQLKRRFRM